MRLEHDWSRNVVLPETTLDDIKRLGIEECTPDSPFLDVDEALIPRNFEFKSRMGRVKSQGTAGTCASFGCIACLEPYFGGKDLSEAHLTDFAERKYDDCCEGIKMGYTMFALTKGRGPGVVEESVWPYDPSKICWKDPPDISGAKTYQWDGLNFIFKRTREEVFANIVEDSTKTPAQLRKDLVSELSRSRFCKYMMQMLAPGDIFPLAISVPVWFKSSGHFDAGWDHGPVIHLPKPVNLEQWIETQEKGPGNENGWHVLALCGYNTEWGFPNEYFHFKNSWGSWWGSRGYGIIPFTYINRYSTKAWFGIIDGRGLPKEELR